MIDYKKIKCTECKKCNHSGMPSVMKGSAYCELQRGTISNIRASAFGRIRMFLADLGKFRGMK